jgi:hypothetical protein
MQDALASHRVDNDQWMLDRRCFKLRTTQPLGAIWLFTKVAAVSLQKIVFGGSTFEHRLH